MKKFFSCFYFLIFLAFPSILSFAQLKEVNDKSEIFGVQLNKEPDYSLLKFYRHANNYAFNIYQIIDPKPFTGNGYTFTEGYVIIKKDKIYSVICPLKDTSDRKKIMNDIKTSGLGITDVSEKQNIHFLFDNLDKKNCLWMFSIAGLLDSNLAADNSGLTQLIGKKFSDPEIQKFLGSMPGKYEIKKYKEGMGIFCKQNGVKMEFFGKKEEATLGLFYIIMDGNSSLNSVYKLEAPYKGVLPYGITEFTPPLRLIDKLGAPDNINMWDHFPRYEKYSIEVEYEHDKAKTAENQKIIRMLIKKPN